MCQQVLFWISELGKMGLQIAWGGKVTAGINRQDLCPWEGADARQLVTYITRKYKLSCVIGKNIQSGRESAKHPHPYEMIAFLTGP